jgi:multiple sugar transport system substrate-binding protein
MKSRFLVLTSLLVILVMLLSACGQPASAPSAPAAEPTKAPAAEATKAPSAAPTATQPPVVISSPGNMDPAAFGLKPGKPYAGTNLKFLICCATAAQFIAGTERTKEFTEMTGITVEWGQTPYAAFQDEILKETASGGGNYDLVTYVDAWGQGIQNFIQPIDDRIKADAYDLTDFPDAYLIPGRNKDGQTMALPYRGHAFMLYYRRDIFEKLGIKVPETWADVEAAAKTIQEKTDMKGLSTYYKINAGQNLFVWESLVWGNGGDLFDKDWKPTFNSPEAVEATQRYVDWLLKDKIVPENATTFAESEGKLELAQGRAAMYPGWSWMWANWRDPKITNPEVLNNVGYVPAPYWEGKGKAQTYGHIWEVGILKASKNQDAAWEYMKWLLSPETEKTVAMDKSDPRIDNVVVVHKSDMLDEEINAKHENLQKTMWDVLQNARTQPMMPEWLQVQSILEIAINSMANGAPVKETLDKAAVEVEDLLRVNGYYQ